MGKNKKQVILIDEDDNQVNWKEIMWKDAWKNIHIPKTLQNKIKIVFDKKDGSPIVKAKNKK